MKRLTLESFIEKANKRHNNKYDYSKVEYKNNYTKVCIICPKHGEFWQTPSSHLNGCGCPKCGFENGSEKRTQSVNEFIERARKIHGNKYDYSKVEYINMKTKVCIICSKHGEFWQTPLNHLMGCGCNKCGRDNYAKNHSKSLTKFVEESRKIHGNKYDYSKAEYKNAYTRVCIICPKHGEFWQRPMEHLNGCGCPKCNESHLEKEIRVMLENNNINYVYQCKSNELKWLGRQSLDFYLPQHNIAIECQGEQHFLQHKCDLYNHEKTVERDIKKYLKCIANGVKLLYYSDLKFNEMILIYNQENSFTNKEKLLNKIEIML